jgi:hypothetical protein
MGRPSYRSSARAFMTKQALPPQITTMHFNIIRSGHTNGRLSTSLLSLYYIACAVTVRLEATKLVTLPIYRASYPRLHDFAARACFTLTRNIRLNVFQERGTGMPPMRRARCHAPHTKRLGLPKPMMDKSLIGPAGRRDLCMHLRALRLPSEKFRRFSAATFWPFVFLAFSFLSYFFLSSE